MLRLWRILRRSAENRFCRMSVTSRSFGMRIFHKPAGRDCRTYEAYTEAFRSLCDNRPQAAHTFWRESVTERARFCRRCCHFIENCICFIPFFMLNNRAVGREYFQNIDFYLLYVLLFAIVHGQQQAIFSSLLAVGRLLLPPDVSPKRL